MTQIELAEKCQALGINLDRASIAKIENGLRCVLDYELAGIACVLKTPPARLLNTGVREIGGDETTRRQF